LHAYYKNLPMSPFFDTTEFKEILATFLSVSKHLFYFKSRIDTYRLKWLDMKRWLVNKIRHEIWYLNSLKRHTINSNENHLDIFMYGNNWKLINSIINILMNFNEEYIEILIRRIHIYIYCARRNLNSKWRNMNQYDNLWYFTVNAIILLGTLFH